MRNVFLELEEIFLTAQDDDSYKNDIHRKAVSQGMIYALQEEIEHWENKLNSSRSQFHYVINLPTHWECEMKEKLIRPLFIQAGFINIHDQPNRLVFFNRLDSTFRLIQSKDKSFKRVKFQNGRQHLMCTLDFGAKTYITLDLFTARYPSFTAIENNYIPQILKSVSFMIPFKPKERKERIQTYLENKPSFFIPTKLCDVLCKRGKDYTSDKVFENFRRYVKKQV